MSYGSPTGTSALPAEQALQQAVTHHKSGQLQDAERLYRAILQVHPEHPDANHNLGLLAVQFKQPALALPLFKTALNANPKQGQFWLSYLDALILTGQTELASNVLKQGTSRGLQGDGVDAIAKRLGQTNTAAPVQQSALEIAIAHRETGNNKDAILVLNNQLRMQPGDAPCHAVLAQILSLEKQDELAWRSLNTALSLAPALPIVQRNHARLLLRQQKPAEALRLAQAAYQGDPADPENQLVLAAALNANNQLEQALSMADRILQSRPNYAEAYANRALFRLRANNHGGALKDAEKALAIKPHIPNMWGMVGTLRQQLNDLPGAIFALEKVLAADSTNVGHLANLGDLKRQVGDSTAAVSLLENAVAIAPNHAAAWCNLGTALQDARRMEEAKVAYAKALGLSPGQAEVANNLGAMAKEEEAWEDALHYFEIAVANKPGLAEAHCNLAVCLQNLRRFDEALASVRTALSINPEFDLAHNNHGAILRDMGQLKEAEASYRRAVNIRPEFAEALSNLGNTLCDLDDNRQAAMAYQQSIQVAAGAHGWIAMINLAILSYLNEDMTLCRANLRASESILTKMAPRYKASRIYWTYLDRLLSWHEKHSNSDDRQEALDTLHVIGESHALSPHGTVVRYNNREMRCKANWIAGCKQWHLGNDASNRFKHKFEAVLARLPHRSTILLCIGEIDCRHDEGIMTAWRKRPGHSLDEIGMRTADHYLDYISAMGAQFGHQFIVGGVPATNVPLREIPVESASQFVEFLKRFNMYLCSQAKAKGMGFLDVYALTDAGNGISNGKWHIDANHLLPTAWAAAFDFGSS